VDGPNDGVDGGLTASDAGTDRACTFGWTFVVRVLTQPVRPAMCLVDMMLPNTTGIELAQELKATRYAQTPMVAMSASNRGL